MKISGFTMARNAGKLYYPIRESILSALPLVDEFVVALGDSEEDDHSREEILSIESDKIKVIDTVWDLEKYPKGMEHAHQTDIAKNACTGDWLLYLQADEVLHEKDHLHIREQCDRFLNDLNVEGFLFKYIHFWGDYEHYQIAHGWYPYEIRIVRNDPEIHSWESAQSFRRIPGFDGLNYRQQENTYKLKVKILDAHVFHYGWVRPPQLMKRKIRYFKRNHHGRYKSEAEVRKSYETFNYGNLDLLPVYSGTHPKVMQEWIRKFNWAEELKDFTTYPERYHHKHEKFRNRVLTFFEQKIFGGKQIGGFKNYILLK